MYDIRPKLLGRAILLHAIFLGEAIGNGILVGRTRQLLLPVHGLLFALTYAFLLLAIVWGYDLGIVFATRMDRKQGGSEEAKTNFFISLCLQFK